MDKRIMKSIAGVNETDALLLRMQGFSFSRIAEMLSIGKTTAQMRVRRGRSRLAAAGFPLKYGNR